MLDLPSLKVSEVLLKSLSPKADPPGMRNL